MAINQGLKIGKIDTSAYNLFLTDAGVFTTFARSYNMISIPGRSGDLEIDNNKFENGTLTFPAVITEDFMNNMIAFKSAINRQVGYQKIVDPFMPGYFRMGIYTNDGAPKMSADQTTGSFTMKFNCKPQLFLNEGDEPKIFTANGTLKNPTGYRTRPLIRLYGTGTLGIGDYSIVVNTAGTDYIDFDCETMDAHEGSQNRNGNVTVAHEPFLNEDTTGITLTGLTKVEITTRWFTIL